MDPAATTVAVFVYCTDGSVGNCWASAERYCSAALYTFVPHYSHKPASYDQGSFFWHDIQWRAGPGHPNEERLNRPLTEFTSSCLRHTQNLIIKQIRTAAYAYTAQYVPPPPRPAVHTRRAPCVCAYSSSIWALQVMKMTNRCMHLLAVL